jgi:predicted amidohydrolase
MLRCGTVQLNHRPGDKAGNFKVVERSVHEAYGAGSRSGLS